MITPDSIEEIGKFLKTHALKGELNAQLDIDASFIDPDTPLIVSLEGIFVPFFPESVRPKGHFASLVKLQGVDSEEEARRFVNLPIFARKADVEDFLGDDDGEEGADEGAYADDLIGFSIVDAGSGDVIGIVEDVDYTTVNTLFIVDAGGETLYIPASPDFITAINPEEEVIEMSLPDGLVDLNSKKNKEQ
ncbi:MAG: ribosome maturation factor RimM [Muribaculaceae bacterium]|nr:ribosome maturation factor RimM [Muribaculaceae bacterium]